MSGAESPEAFSGERRRLSAADTDLAKIVVMGFGLVFLPASVLMLTIGAPVYLPLFVLAVVGVNAWQSFRLKDVETDGHRLYVSTFFQTMSLPLTLVESVDAAGWPFRPTVTVRFRSVTPFGSQIVFRPRGAWVPFASGQKVVEELRELVARANLGRPPGQARLG